MRSTVALPRQTVETGIHLDLDLDLDQLYSPGSVAAPLVLIDLAAIVLAGGAR
ncbi:hypothetical protein Ae706Ps2_6386 [Pseudonocardia sp. Ae706_Ps2]|uniref:hypothetical protein n=1 Tax=unclassified Pseudonocardia TaxID=2619320 RepID=UPI00096388A5|nr:MULTISPECIES: hypothetical protein [unclassified Pseudonocardia]OLM09488.1 hypothetical protein Ae706Ps2_6386 [Pseudonocardia sp. Ae706_Ps2]